MGKAVIIIILAIVFLISPVSADLYQFQPGSDSISSAGVKGAVDGMNGEVIFATDNGLSVYYPANRSWEIIHKNYNNRVIGQLDDYILSLELDQKGNLWLGYSNGLQMYNGTYTTINDQQLLKNLIINDLRCQGDEMWVATGNSGLHSFRNGSWTWYQPYGEEGLCAYEINSIAIDNVTDSLILASNDGGVWLIKKDDGSCSFKPVMYNDMPFSTVVQARTDPCGGAYIFNKTTIFHCIADGSATRIVDNYDFGDSDITIRDIAATLEGLLVIGTNTGIFVLQNGIVKNHFDMHDGLVSNKIDFLYIDNYGNCWFTLRDCVGYITELIPGYNAQVDYNPIVVVTPTGNQNPENNLSTEYSDIIPEPEQPDEVFQSVMSVLMSPSQDVVFDIYKFLSQQVDKLISGVNTIF